jgi:putative salt-induced outer membrane protein YdiY
MNKTVLGLLCLTLVSLPVAGQSPIITLVLRNGDRISGRLVSENTKAITVKLPWNGNVTIPANQVMRRETTPGAAGLTASVQTRASEQPPAALRLDELLQLYKTDRISPAQYQSARTKILAETPDIPAATQTAASPPLPTPATTAPPAVVPSDKTTTPAITPKETPVASGKPATSTPPAQSAATPAPPSSAPAKTKPPAVFHGEAQFGMEAGFNNKSFQVYSGRFNATYAKNKFHHALDYTVSYGRSDGQTTVDRMEGSWRMDYDLDKKFFTYLSTSSGYDRLRKVDLYYQIGPGFGYKLINRTNLVMNVTAGASYQDYFYSGNVRHNDVFLSLGEELTWTLFSKLTLVDKIEFNPNSGHFAEYRLRWENSLRYPMSKRIFLSLTALDLYDTTPAPGVDNNDLQIRSTIGFKF